MNDFLLFFSLLYILYFSYYVIVKTNKVLSDFEKKITKIEDMILKLNADRKIKNNLRKE